MRKAGSRAMTDATRMTLAAAAIRLGLQTPRWLAKQAPLRFKEDGR